MIQPETLAAAKTWAERYGAPKIEEGALVAMYESFRRRMNRAAAYLYARLEPWGA